MALAIATNSELFRRGPTRNGFGFPLPFSIGESVLGKRREERRIEREAQKGDPWMEPDEHGNGKDGAPDGHQVRPSHLWRGMADETMEWKRNVHGM